MGDPSLLARQANEGGIDSARADLIHPWHKAMGVFQSAESYSPRIRSAKSSQTNLRRSAKSHRMIRPFSA